MSLFGDNPFRNPQPLPEKKMDPVDPKELKGKHADRTDKDIDNDGDVDSSDKFLHKKRKAITKNIKKDDDADAGNDDAIKEEEVDMEEAADLDDKNVEKAMKHDCATHVTHEEHGAGECIPGMHTLVPANEEMEEWEATVSHYDVMFEGSDGKPFIVENVPVQELKIDKSESHMHKRKK
jgi:hypothetical protein